MLARFNPEIYHAYSLASLRAWHAEPNQPVLLRTTPFPRGAELVRVRVRVVLCSDHSVRRRFVLRAEQISEDGWLQIRFPKLPARALLHLRLCVGAVAGPPKVLLLDAAPLTPGARCRGSR